MILDAVATNDWTRWGRHSASELLDHGMACCQNARNWFGAMARSYESPITEGQQFAGTRWLNSRYQWGPNPWPLAWCEAIRREKFDCGVFATMAREIFKARGLSAHGAQVILRHDPRATPHFDRLWRDTAQSFAWVGKDFVYHELTLLEIGGTARLYDATEGFWLPPEFIDSHKAPVAIRSQAGRALSWGRYRLFPDQWCELEREAR